MSQITVPILRCQMRFTLRQACRTLHISRTKLSQKKQIDTYKGNQQITTDVRPLSEKVKDTAKTTSYLGVILLGVGVTGAMFYTIFSELFSSNSPNSIYSKALEKCIAHPKVQDLLGEPIKGFGEETRRGRRGHVSHVTYIKNGVKHLKMVFYIQGTRNRATVHLEMAENSAGSYDCRYLIVQLDDYTKRTITIENNQLQIDETSKTENSLLF